MTLTHLSVALTKKMQRRGGKKKEFSTRVFVFVVDMCSTVTKNTHTMLMKI
jgi:hypothetical protein